jgi:hypothetical protein
MQYVKKQGDFWIKTKERTGWWIAGKKSDVFIITNGFRCEYVRKECIKDFTFPNSNPSVIATKTTTKEATEQQQQQQSQTEQKQKRKRGRPPGPQQICPKCSSLGIVIERLVKSYIYRSIRHKEENGKIKECVIQNISKAIYR